MNYDCGDSPGSYQLTVSCWIRNQTEREGVILGTGIPGKYQLKTKGDSVRIQVFTESNGFQATPYAYLPRDNWTHVAFTYYHGWINLYVDKRLQSETETAAPLSITNSNDFVIIGVDGGGFYNAEYRDYFQGAIDDLRLYRKALNDYQIGELFLEGIVPTVSLNY